MPYTVIIIVGGVAEAVISVWLNDGAENSLFAALPGMAYFSQQAYNPGTSQSDFKELFFTQTGADFDSFMLLGELDEIHKTENEKAGGNPSKYLLWQDVLLGLFDYYIRDIDVNLHYGQLKVKMESAKDSMGPYSQLMEMMSALSGVLSTKSTMGLALKQAYDTNNRAALEQIALKVLPNLIKEIDMLRIAHLKLWMITLKPFGFEILDGRYGALTARLSTASQRICEYLNGDIPQIAELEAERLPYFKHAQGLPLVLTYDRIVSGGYQNGPVR